MAWWFDVDNRCGYEEWVKRAGGLVEFLDTFCKDKNFDTVLELGTGNSTRALAKRSKGLLPSTRTQTPL